MEEMEFGSSTITEREREQEGACPIAEAWVEVQQVPELVGMGLKRILVRTEIIKNAKW